MEEIEDFVPIVPDIPVSQLAKTPKRTQETPKKVQDNQNNKLKNPLDTFSTMSSPKVLMIIFAVIIVILIVVIVWLFIRKPDNLHSATGRQFAQPQSQQPQTPQSPQSQSPQPQPQSQQSQSPQSQSPQSQSPQSQSPQSQSPQSQYDVSELMKYAQMGLNDNALVPHEEAHKTQETQEIQEDAYDKPIENETLQQTMEDAKLNVIQQSLQKDMEENYQQTLIGDAQPYETYIETNPVTLAVNNAQQTMLTGTCMYVINHRSKTSTICGKQTINGTQFCAKHQTK